MYRTLIAICTIVSGATIFYACSGSPAGNDSDDDNGSKEPTEFSAGITSPGNGDILEGVVTITAEAEASGGIEEVRFFLGEDLLFTADSSPFEYKIDTREYPNGTHEIRIEAAMAEADSAITKTVSVELENYMVEFETERFVTNFNNGNNNNEWITDFGLYLFISAPDGTVLAEEELAQDGLLQLLPPETLPDGAPEHYQLTIAQFRIDREGREILNLTTETALESWAPFRIEAAAGSGNNLSPREVEVKLTNIQNDPFAFIFLSTLTGHVFNYDGGSPDEPFLRPATVGENQDHLILTSIPSAPPYAEGVIPRYYWEKDLGDTTSSVSYDVAEQFEEMSIHTVNFPSNIQPPPFLNFFSMSVEQDSWEAGSVFFQGNFFSQASSSGMKMYVPNTAHQYQIGMSGSDVSASDIRYFQSVHGALPSSFEALNAEVTVASSSLDNVKMQASGSVDIIKLYARANAQDFSYRYSWNVFQADTATSFIFPRVADSLDQKITHYNRSEFQVDHLEVTDFAAIDGYEEYRERRTSGEGGQLYKYQSVTKLLNSGQQKRKALEPSGTTKYDKRQQGSSFHPPYRLIRY